MNTHFRFMRKAISDRCTTGKLCYETRRDAMAHAKALRRHGDHVRPYLCPECFWFHVGHLDYKMRRGIAHT